MIAIADHKLIQAVNDRLNVFEKHIEERLNSIEKQLETIHRDICNKRKLNLIDEKAPISDREEDLQCQPSSSVHHEPAPSITQIKENDIEDMIKQENDNKDLISITSSPEKFSSAPAVPKMRTESTALCDVRDIGALDFDAKTQSFVNNDSRIKPHILSQLIENARRLIDPDVLVLFAEDALVDALKRQMLCKPSVKEKRFAFTLLCATLKYDDDILMKISINPHRRVINSGQLSDHNKLILKQCDVVANVCRATASYFNWHNLCNAEKLVKTQSLLIGLRNDVKTRLYANYKARSPPKRHHSVLNRRFVSSSMPKSFRSMAPIDLPVFHLSDNDNEGLIDNNSGMMTAIEVNLE